ncbi:TPA: acyltransferase, partial [Aeromonas veronii]
SHNYKSMNYIPYGENDEDLLGTITIDDHVWIGLGVTILKGVYIGEGAVIAAQSVVTKNVDAYSIVAGNPAKIIGHRDVELFLRLKKDNKLYLSRHS